MPNSPTNLLQQPRLTGREQSRPRLALAGGTGTTLVWAGAGTGKTTLLALWAAELRARGEAAVWVSLPGLGGVRPRLADLTRLTDLTRASPTMNGTTTSGSRAPASASRVTLLFDDLDHLDDPADGEWLAELMGSRPRNIRLVLAGRHPPQLLSGNGPGNGPGNGSGNRSGTRSGTVEYRTVDLAFTRTETGAFLAARGIHLAPPDLDAAQELTGGWAAALTLLTGSYLGADSRWQELATYARIDGPYALTDGPRTRTNGRRNGSGPRGLLTPKEQEILRELPQYQTVRNIAARQQLSPNTVKTHIRSLYQKLGVSNRTAAVAKAIEQGLL